MKLMPITLGRVLALVVVCALAVAGFSIASALHSDSKSSSVLRTLPLPTKVVPAVVGQPYVFAESTLQAHGFGWKVEGPVKGWARAVVVSQSPAHGTKVVNTGAPLVTLWLSLPKGYVPIGTPENASSYPATKIMLPSSPAATVTSTPTTVTSTATKTTTKKPSIMKLVVNPKPKPSQASRRPRAFVIAGAKREPLDEIPLPERARDLNTWIDSHRNASAADQRYWLYQHAWIVTGAKFGWWHGAQALETLIAVDRRIEALWGIGSKSEAEARAALGFVHAHGG